MKNLIIFNFSQIQPKNYFRTKNFLCLGFFRPKDKIFFFYFYFLFSISSQNKKPATFFS